MPGESGELLGDEERLGEELLNPPGASHEQLVILAQLVNTENGDDVLQVFVALEDLLYFSRSPVVLFTDDIGSKGAAG